jgi:DNA-binding NarL/FixJ family response regulator
VRRTRVAIATRDETLSVALMVRLVRKRNTVSLACPASDAARLLSWLDEARPDVLLLDERWLHRLDPRSAKTLHARCPNLSVLILCDRACAALAEKIVRRRFQGLLLADAAVDACVKAIRAVGRGELWVPRALLVELVLGRLHAPDRWQAELAAVTKLTHREAQVIGYLRRGLANKQIADALAIREDTVKKHLRNAYTKLGVHRRSEILVHGTGESPAAG